MLKQPRMMNPIRIFVIYYIDGFSEILTKQEIQKKFKDPKLRNQIIDIQEI